MQQLLVELLQCLVTTQNVRHLRILVRISSPHLLQVLLVLAERSNLTVELVLLLVSNSYLLLQT